MSMKNESEKKEWTIMVYMSGDNNLSVDMNHALKNIKNVAEDNQKLNLFVYYDGSSRAIPTLYCDFTDFDNPKYIPSHLIDNKLHQVDNSILNEDSSKKESVLNFVDWCVNKVDFKVEHTHCVEECKIEHIHCEKECQVDKIRLIEGRKAENYGLIFSGHSFGFQSIGLLKDEFTGHSMSMEEMESFLTEINENLICGKLGILGFDSCVMSMLEVGYQFRDLAETMIASEGSVPSAGWAYTEILGRLAHSSEHNKATEVATQFVKDFIKTEDSFTLSSSSVDMTAWDLSKLENINEPFATLNQKLLDCFEDETSTIYKQMKRVLSHVHRSCQTYMLKQNVDLGDFCELLKSEVSSLKKELSVDFSDNLESTLEVLADRKDLNAKVHQQLDSLKGLNKDLRQQLDSILKNLTDRKDLSRDLHNKLDSIEYLNSDLDNQLDSITDACDDVLEKLRECVLLSGFSGGKYQFSNGMSLFFPWSKSAYLVSSEDYRKLHFVENTEAGKKWRQFLIKYLGEVTFRRSIHSDCGEHKLFYNPCPWHQDDEDCDANHTDDSKQKELGAPKHRMTDDGSDSGHQEKELGDPKHRMMSDGAGHKEKELGDPKHRMMSGRAGHKEKELGDPKHRMMSGNGTGYYLEFFMHYDNTEILWNVSGFTKSDSSESTNSSENNN